MSWRKAPLRAATWPPLDQNPLPHAGLVTTLPEEHAYACRVEGELPRVNGTLYRIGPGRYDRGPDRKRMVLDGDGMVQALHIRDGGAWYRNRYVRTAKLVAEEAAGRFLYPTFSTHGSGPMRHNLGLRLANQANTTVVEWAGRLWALDESQVPYALTRELETIGERPPDAQRPGLRYWAHWKLDATCGRLHMLAIQQGPRMVAHIVTLDAQGAVAERHSVPLPRTVYFHDWFVTARHFAFLLHPAIISPAKMLQVLVGRETFSEALQWRPEKGAVMCVVDRANGELRTVEAPACWMWHAINAFDEGEDLVCDLVGSDLGGNLGDDASVLFSIMRGEQATLPPEPFNTLRRYRVNMARGTLDAQIIDATANFELPGISATERGREYTSACLIRAQPGEIFARGLARLDARDLTTRTHLFPDGEFCSEPVYLDSLDGPRATHVITQVYDSTRRRSYYAVLEDANLEAGPVARIELEHHAPLSFHGYWSGARAAGAQTS